MTQEIMILKADATGKDGKKFPTYKMNLNGKKVDLKFRQDSDNLSMIPNGISRIKVEGLSESTTSFYPRYYATFRGLVERTVSPELKVNAETGEIQE